MCLSLISLIFQITIKINTLWAIPADTAPKLQNPIYTTFITDSSLFILATSTTNRLTQSLKIWDSIGSTSDQDKCPKNLSKSHSKLDPSSKVMEQSTTANLSTIRSMDRADKYGLTILCIKDIGPKMCPTAKAA